MLRRWMVISLIVPTTAAGQPTASTFHRDTSVTHSTQLSPLEQPGVVLSARSSGAVAVQPKTPQLPANQTQSESPTAITVTALEVGVAEPRPASWRENVTGLWRQVAATTTSPQVAHAGSDSEQRRPEPHIVAPSPPSDLRGIVRRSSLVQQLIFAETGDLVDPTKAAAANSDARLVAHLQEQPAEPEQLQVEPNDELIPEPAAPAAERENRAAEGDSLAGAERLGEAPEDRSLDFLRTETVLLEPGESQCDVGITYLLTENEFPILLTDGMGEIVAVDEVDFRIRELSVPLEYRMGLLPRVQGFIGAPIGWSNTQVALDAFDAFQNDGGFGDIDFGLTAQCVEASANCPYVIGTLAATAPTGGDPFTGALSLAPTAPSLGQGFWSISGSLLFIQPYDPVVVFYGIGTEHFFSRHYVGVEIEPGSQYNYQLGVGFAVNERVTLSTRFFGAYVEEIKVNGDRRFGTNIEPMTIRLSATISQPCDRLVEPFVEFGITDDAVSSFFGITWTFSPKSQRKANESTNESSKRPAAQ
jgi:hypothetical protein